MKNRLLSFLKSWTVLAGMAVGCLGFSASHAKEFPYSATLKGSDIVTNQNMATLTDNDFAAWYAAATAGGSLPANWALSVNHQYMKGSVTFRVVGETVNGPKLASAINETIQVSIGGTQWLNGQKVTMPSKTVSLTIQYGPSGQSFNTQYYARYDVDNVIELSVSVVKGLTNTAAAPFVELVSEIQSARIREIPRGSAGMVSMVKIDDNNLMAHNLLNVSWAAQDAAEAYDLEWIHVDGDNVTDGQGVNNASDPSQVSITEDLFRTSTRVTVTSTSYSVPVIYEKGWLVFRVRAVGRMAVNPAIGTYGIWSTDGLLPKNLVDFDENNRFTVTKDFQDGLNWQYSVNYAEEGKNKVVISYHDGTMRNRQSATKMNSNTDVINGEAIVGETIYDYEGRGAVNILPVPTGTASIGYQAGLNKNSANKPYNRDNFDLTGTDACHPSPDALPTTGTGASNYYSKSNQNTTGKNAYIPDAQGYPMTQVEYTPDNTGKIKRQSGVGKDHQLGSGHETKYFYGTPNSQEELDRLFGSDAGYVKHYKKNATVDPNGQVTVTYLDMENRVVATALSGDAPKTLDPLSSKGTSPITSILFDGNNADVNTRIDKTDIPSKGNTIEKELLITSNANYSFNYTVIPEYLLTDCIGRDAETGTNSNDCYNCVVEATVLVTDACNVQYLMDLDTDASNGKTMVLNQAILTNIQNQNYTIPSTPSGVSFDSKNVSNWDNAKALTVGEYTLKRVFKVNKEALDYYTKKYLLSPCVRKFEGFLTEEQNKVDTTGCNVGCDKCLTKLGDYSQYDPVKTKNTCAPCYTYDEYKKMQDLCTAMCDQRDLTCDAAYSQMLGDVTIGGQYGQIFKDVTRCSNEQYNPQTQQYDCIKTYQDKVIDPSGFPLSLYNENNALPSQPTWRNPKRVDLTTDANFYYEEDGTKSIVQILISADKDNHTVYTPDVVQNDAAHLFPAYDEAGNLLSNVVTTYPQNLKNFTDFMLLWRKSWAASLVGYHPEFPSYASCLALQTSRDFDQALLELTFDNATSSNGKYILDFLQHPETKDPFLTLSGFTKEIAQLKNLLKNYGPQSNDPHATPLSMYQYAYVISVCPYYNTHKKCPTNCIPSAADDYTGLTQDIWNNFLSLYRGAKTKIYDAWMTHQAITVTNSYNGCIGNKNWTSFSDNFINYGYAEVHVTSPRYNWCYGYAQPWGTSYYGSGFPCFYTPVRTYYTFHSQYYNGLQPCAEWTAKNYVNGQKVFLTASDLQPDAASQTGSTCYASPSLDPSNAAAFDNSLYDQSLAQTQDCSDWTQKISSGTQTQAEMAYLQECKQCPVSKSLTDLMTAMIGKGGYTSTTPIQLSCSVGQFTDTLEARLKLNYDLVPDVIDWKYKETKSYTGYSELVIEIGPNPPQTGNPTLHLYVPNTLDFSKVTSFCCLNYLANPSDATMIPASAFTDHPGGTFKIGAVIPATTAGTGTYALTQTIVIEGYVDLIHLNSCDFRVCQPTAASQGWSNFINALLFQRPAIGTDYQEIDPKTVPGTNFVIYNDYLDVSTSGITQATLDGNSANQGYLDLITDSMIVQYFPKTVTPSTVKDWKVRFDQAAGSTVFTIYLDAYNTSDALIGTTSLALTLPANVDISSVLSFRYSGGNKDAKSNEANYKFKASILVKAADNSRHWQEIDAVASFAFCDCQVYGYDHLPSSAGK